MTSEIITLFGFVLSLILVIFVFIFYRRAARLDVLLTEASNRLKLGENAYNDLKNQLKNQNVKLEKKGEALTNIEKALAEARERNSSLNQGIRDAKTEHQAYIDKLTRQRDHFQEQVNVLTTQLQDSDAQKRQAEDEIKARLNETTSKNNKEIAVLHKKNKELTDELSENEKREKTYKGEITKLKGLLKKIDMDGIRKSKQRSLRLEQLYTSMKGLREMAEERNQNWEVALRKLSAHILSKSDVDEEGNPLPIGPLVGAALEKAGLALVKDEISYAEFEQRKADENKQMPETEGAPTVDAGAEVKDNQEPPY